ncbi:MAG: hypothetical protein VB107_04205 [Aminivibrio sp.]|nr:hypothetical protein [Aminivibrio sp.]MEA4951851.1 hypothetical protein [Aminivibrio sp.]
MHLLLKQLDSAVFLDGDWCWNMNPFIVNDETKKMVLKNISFMLNSFLGCSEYRYIIFCWVMYRQEILDDLLSRLVLDDVSVYKFSLVASEAALTRRLEKDAAEGRRDIGGLPRSMERLGPYEGMDTIKIDISERTAAWAAGIIMKQIGR